MANSMVLSQGVLNAITIIERVGSVLSVIGCIFIIVTFLSSSAFRKPINRLVFYASFGNMLVNVGTLIARAFVDKVNSPGCQFQAFLIQQFLPSDALWALAMAFNVYLTFYYKFDAEKLKKMEKWYLLICYGLPFPPALSYIFISTKSNGRVYGNATLWCWVSSEWEVLRIATFYALIWVILLATFFIYIRAGREIYEKRRQLLKLDSNSASGNELDIFKLYELYPLKTTEISVTSESVTQTQPQVQPNVGVDPLRDIESKANSESQGPAAYSITICSDREHPPVMPSNMEASPSVVQAKAKRRKNQEASTAAWAYTKCAILFFTALLVTWIPSSANRVYSLVHNGEALIVLEILSAIVLPLQGFWNAIIYLVTSWAAVKLFFSGLFQRSSDDNKPSGYAGRRDGDPRHISFTRKRKSHKNEDTDSMTELAGNAIPISKFSQ